MIGENRNVGGVVAQCAGNIFKCTNSGLILSYSNAASDGMVQMGGIIGYFTKGDNVISECTNKGTIKSLGLISNNISTADGAAGIGGIVGNARGTIEKCENYGKINANNKIICVGGIAGHLNSSSTIKECINRGNITKLNSTDAINFVGRICGDMSAKTDPNITDSTLEKCYNSGSVEGNKWIGGILGYLEGTEGQGTVKECYNKGTVTGTKGVGSIIGNCQEAGDLNTFSDLYYLTIVGIGAINNGPDDTSKKIMALPVTSGNFNSKDEFLNWLANENNP